MRILKLCFLLFGICTTVGVASESADSPAAAEAKLLSNIRQLTFEGKRAGEGYFSADGSRLIFQSEREADNPFFQIYLMDLQSGDTERVSPGWGKTTCSWIHPDGRKVLFASTQDDPDARKKQQAEFDLRASGKARRYSWDYDETYEIFEVDLATKSTRNLTGALGYDAEGSWSPDGRQIVFSSNRHAYSGQLSDQEKQILVTDQSYFVDIYLMNADGSNIRRLTDVPGYDGGPFFSPDGRRIVWRRFSEDGVTSEVYTMNLDGSGVEKVTHLGAMSWAPYYHPSGDYLIFGTNLHGFANFELYLVDLKGQSQPVRVTYTEGFDSLPVFSPDGRKIVWTSNRTPDKTSQLFVADWNDETARDLLGLSLSFNTKPEITPADLKTHVQFLASEQTGGRLTGTPGAGLAARYLASFLKSLGFEPAGDGGTFLQDFEFTSGVSLGPANEVTVETPTGRKSLLVNQDWRPVAFSQIGRIEAAPVVFAGYGITAPAEGDFPEYDSYVHLDVKDKWVLILRFLPEEVTAERRQHLAHYSGLRYKTMAARERGAKGIIVVSGPTSKVTDQLVELAFDTALGSTSIATLSVSDEVGQFLLEAAGKNLADTQEELDKGDPVMGQELPGVRLSANIDIVQEKRHGQNVVGRMPAVEGQVTNPALLIGAHYDHLGHGAGMSSLARPDEKQAVHYGADDNASGVATVTDIAEYLNSQKKSGRLNQKRDLLVAFWAGEELGLLGSSHYARSFAEGGREKQDLSGDIAAYLNLDMVGRLRDQLVLQGVGSSSIWPAEIEKRNAPIGLSIVTQDDSYLPTDTTSFYLKKVPVLSAFTGVHSEYHSPRDTPDTLNYQGMTDVGRLMALISRSLLIADQSPDYREMKRPDPGSGRARLRAYLGTIPDYVQGEIAGLKLNGVIEGGPASRAGLQGGDIIVELAGRKIENIYDYTYAIEALKIGEAMKVVVVRAGEKMTFEVTPGSRE